MSLQELGKVVEHIQVEQRTELPLNHAVLVAQPGDFVAIIRPSQEAAADLAQTPPPDDPAPEAD